MTERDASMANSSSSPTPPADTLGSTHYSSSLPLDAWRWRELGMECVCENYATPLYGYAWAVVNYGKHFID